MKRVCLVKDSFPTEMEDSRRPKAWDLRLKAEVATGQFYVCTVSTYVSFRRHEAALHLRHSCPTQQDLWHP